MSKPPLFCSDDSTKNANPPNRGRRRFLQSAAAAATVGSAPHLHGEDKPVNHPAQTAPATSATARTPLQSVKLTINGRPYQLKLEPRVTLLDALREYVGLMGTKKGCDRGQCGACTVLANGRRINACLTLAVMHEGDSITTVEGLGDGVADMTGANGATNSTGVKLSPMQLAFIEHDAFQCGYCTPGQLCSATGLLDEFRAGAASAATHDVRTKPPELTEAEVRERMSGNICRCGAYPNIVAAVIDVHKRRRTV
jgi:xanthine dehydrogenase YagT iron-sulfur-binding subunit